MLASEETWHPLSGGHWVWPSAGWELDMDGLRGTSIEDARSRDLIPTSRSGSTCSLGCIRLPNAKEIFLTKWDALA